MTLRAGPVSRSPRTGTLTVTLGPPKPRPRTLSLGPRPRPAITLARSSPSVISPQPVSLSNPDSDTLSHLVLSECDFSSVKSPQSRFCHFVTLAVLSECDFPTASPLVETGLGCQSHRSVRVWLLSWCPLSSDPVTLSDPILSASRWGRDPLTLSVTQSCHSGTSQLPRLLRREPPPPPAVRLSVTQESCQSVVTAPQSGHFVVTLGPLRPRTTPYPSAAPRVSPSASLRPASWPGATLTWGGDLAGAERPRGRPDPSAPGGCRSECEEPRLAEPSDRAGPGRVGGGAQREAGGPAPTTWRPAPTGTAWPSSPRARAPRPASPAGYLAALLLTAAGRRPRKVRCPPDRCPGPVPVPWPTVVWKFGCL